MSGYQTMEPPPVLDDRPAYSTGLSRLSVLQSARRHPFLTLLPVVVLLLVSIGYSLQRTPTYTAEARMTVAKLDLSQPGALNGFANATQALATAYSRSITANEVIGQVAKDTRLPPLEVRARLEASPIPESPIFRITAEGTSANQAKLLANSASDALRTYVNKAATGPSSATNALLREYRDKTAKVTSASQRMERARRVNAASPTNANRKAVAEAQAVFSAARLQADVAGNAYTSSASAGSSSQGVDILTEASSSTNDRRIKLQIYAFVALVVGGFLGVGLATFVEDRRFRRALRSGVR